jgi:hypothetical protein
VAASETQVFGRMGSLLDEDTDFIVDLPYRRGTGKKLTGIERKAACKLVEVMKSFRRFGQMMREDR